MKSLKKILKGIGIFFVAMIVLGALFGGDKQNTEEPTNSESAEQTEEALTISLNADEIGEYGKEIILNEGTDSEIKVIAYYVPVGKYDVTNDGQYTAQVNVYGDNIQTTEEGWEEFEVGSIVLVGPGKTVEIEVKDNHQFVRIVSPTMITLVKK